MRNIKKVSILLLSLVMIFTFKSTVKANDLENLRVDREEVLRWEQYIDCYPSIEKNSGNLSCKAYVNGNTNTTKIRMRLTLEEKTSSGWISLAGWVTTEYSSSLSASYTYPRASSGKTYRLTVTADVTTNGRTETVSRSVTESF